MRLTFVHVGAQLVERFQGILWLFGGFLVYTGLKLAFASEDVHPEDNVLLKFFKRFLPVTNKPAGDRFFVEEAGRWVATPLFLVLIVVESTDVLFAVDSVPRSSVLLISMPTIFASLFSLPMFSRYLGSAHCTSS